MATVLITGGAGFIGRHCARHFLKNEWEVKVFDLQALGEHDELVQDGCIGLVGDVRSKEALRQAMEGCDAVVHLAALVSVPRSIKEPQLTMEINVKGTRNVLECASKLSVKHTIVASSAAVYGEHTTLPLDEGVPVEFLSPYGESKAINEEDVMLFRERGLNTLALRFFNVYGPGQRQDSAYASLIPRFVNAMVSNISPTIFGDGTQTRDFVHVDDLARAICALLSLETPFEHAVVNVATQTQTSVLELIEVINQHLVQIEGREIIVPLISQPRKGDILHSLGSNSRLCRMIDWEPEIQFEDGIIALLKGYKGLEQT